jgi:hypothetical protein
MKPHVKVIQRNGVDIFVTSSMTMKDTNSHAKKMQTYINAINGIFNKKPQLRGFVIKG